MRPLFTALAWIIVLDQTTTCTVQQFGAGVQFSGPVDCFHVVIIFRFKSQSKPWSQPQFQFQSQSQSWSQSTRFKSQSQSKSATSPITNCCCCFTRYTQCIQLCDELSPPSPSIPSLPLLPGILTHGEELFDQDKHITKFQATIIIHSKEVQTINLVF